MGLDVSTSDEMRSTPPGSRLDSVEWVSSPQSPAAGVTLGDKQSAAATLNGPEALSPRFVITMFARVTEPLPTTTSGLPANCRSGSRSSLSETSTLTVPETAEVTRNSAKYSPGPKVPGVACKVNIAGVLVPLKVALSHSEAGPPL